MCNGESPSLFRQAPFKSANGPSPSCLGNSPLLVYWFFVTPPSRALIKIFRPLTPSHLLKVTTVLVKTSQFKFLVDSEKYFCSSFLSLKISDLSLLFYVKSATFPLKKVNPCFLATPLKWRRCQCPQVESGYAGCTLCNLITQNHSNPVTSTRCPVSLLRFL